MCEAKIMTQWHFGWGILFLFGAVGIEMVCRTAWQYFGFSSNQDRPQLTKIGRHKRRDQNMRGRAASL